MPRDLPSDITSPIIAPTLSHHSISLETWRGPTPKYSNLAIGGFILRLSPKDKSTQLLLLKRASTDSYPNMWEPPGGSVDKEDLTLFHGLVREVWEESGLRVTKINRQIWDKDGKGKEEVSFPGRRGALWCKLNFLIEVQTKEDGEVDVELDQTEHQKWGWFSKDEMEELPFITLQAREIARNAFAAYEESVTR